MTVNRPGLTHGFSRTMSMEDMINNANAVLWEALNPDFHGIPREWATSATAVIMLTVVQAGLVVTGSVGTGIIVRRKSNCSWSHPSACALVGGGVGLMGGASVKHVLIFVKGEDGLNAVTSEHGLTVGGEAEATLGWSGRTVEVDVQLSNRGMGASYAVAFSKGAMVGVAVQGAVVGARLAANQEFYESDATPRQILMDDKAVQIPEESREAMDQVYAKLIALTSTYEEEEVVVGSEEEHQQTQMEGTTSASSTSAEAMPSPTTAATTVGRS